MAQTFLWHDYETFGAQARWDRPSEFGCIRTNSDFEPVADALEFRCQPTLDYLPDPQACLITGIGPETAWASGLPEPAFAERIHAQMAAAATCSVGYNSMRFDDEITRHLYWRNFFDPYEREWAQGNSRFDLIDLVRATYALRPGALPWPRREDGHASFKLTDLTTAFALPHAHAHSALSDVEATLALARLLRAEQPRLVDYALALRSKARVHEMLVWQRRQPVVHVSQRFPAQRGCLAVVVPLALHPTQSGKIIVADTLPDPAPLLTWPAERIAQAVLTPASDPDRVAVGLKLVHANRAPFLAPLSVLEGVDLTRICLDRAQAQVHIQQLQAADGLDAKVQQVYSLLERQSPEPQDADAALYEGFISNADRALARRFRLAPASEQAHLATRFADPRLLALATRYRARHQPDSLSSTERKLWLQECRKLLNRKERPLDSYRQARHLVASQNAPLAAELLRWEQRVCAHAGLAVSDDQA